MQAVRQENTAPEIAVRRALHGAGLRFRLHVADLPGRPDIVLPKRRTVVFVHGCFWHGHDCRHGDVKSKSNREFWDRKLAANRTRDERKALELRRAGWTVEVIWECETRKPPVLARLIRRLLRR